MALGLDRDLTATAGGVKVGTEWDRDIRPLLSGLRFARSIGIGELIVVRSTTPTMAVPVDLAYHENKHIHLHVIEDQKPRS